jgi:glycosyltransferase involved in cell wall biosynthesis
MNKKICFLFSAIRQDWLAEVTPYVQALRIPEGYEVEMIAVESSGNLFADYNRLMRSSDARYKVYLQEDAFPVYKDLLLEMVEVFTAHPEVGLLGVAGAEQMMLTAHPLDGPFVYGELHLRKDGRIEHERHRAPSGLYHPVQGLFGGLLITQYDITWREDLFRTPAFIGTSQAIEFRKAGFAAAVPKQEEPWLLFDGPFPEAALLNEHQTFAREYAQQIYPLVSVLIPAYNRPDYLEVALQSVLDQTYKHIEIVICDDSTNDLSEQMIQPYLAKHPNIRYFRNERNLGQFENDLRLFDLAEGEYINYLMDDDLFHVTKIERMMDYYLRDAEREITLVTSHRQRIDSKGNLLPDKGDSMRLFKKDCVTDGIVLGNLALKNNFNFLGEPTTVLFRKRDLKEPFGTFGGRKYGCNVDMASWLNLLAKGKAVYIADTLSYFRIHDNQQLNSPGMRLKGIADFAHEILYSPNLGFLSDPRDFRAAAETWMNYTSQVLAMLKQKQADDLLDEVLDWYEMMIQAYRKSFKR